MELTYTYNATLSATLGFAHPNANTPLIIIITSILKLHLQVVYQILHLELPKGANLHIEPHSSADLGFALKKRMN